MKTMKLLAASILLSIAGCNRTQREPATVVASCTWQKGPSDLYPKNWLCVDEKGQIAGTVRFDGYIWAAYLGGGYCETGGGFIDEASAKACIARYYKTQSVGSMR